MAEEIRVYDGKYIKSLVKRCEELSPFIENVFKAVENAKGYAKRKEDPWMIGNMRRIEEELARLKLETNLYCGVVKALQERAGLKE